MERSAVVTGASRGIGRGVARMLAASGWRVVVNYASSAEAAEACVREIEAEGGAAVAVGADVGRSEDRARLVEEAVAAFGSIELLVNNAGVTSEGRSDLLEASEEAFDRLMAINLKGPFFLTQQVARHMRERAAAAPGFRAVVNISSLSAYTVSTNRGDYCMAKAAMGMMTSLWAARLAEWNIHVYEVRPGIIATDMTAPVREKYDRLIHEEGMLPIARWGEPEDVGRAVAMLAGGVLSYSTGQVLDVDGGFHIRRL